MDDGSTVPILTTKSSRRLEDVDLIGDEPPVVRDDRSPRVQVRRAMRLEPHTQTWVEATCNHDGLVTIVSAPRLFQSTGCLVASGVATVQRGRTFKILVANFSEGPVNLTANQVVANAQKPPSALEEADYSHAEILGVVPEDRSRMFRKCNTSACDVALINKYL